MRLHGDMGVKMVQRAISLLAAIPTTLVHALNLFVTSARALVLLGTRDRNERVDLRQTMLLALATHRNRETTPVALGNFSRAHNASQSATFHLACAIVPCGAKEGAKGIVLAVALKYTWP